jgi:preprotein translocase subunit SecD
VALTLRAGRPGIDDFNDLAARCYAKAPECPVGQVAIVIDDYVISAPAIQASSYERDQITISGAFTEQEAKDLADAIA